SHSTSTLLPFLYSTGPPPTEISTLSLHDALPISGRLPASGRHLEGTRLAPALPDRSANHDPRRFRPGKAGGRAGHGPRAAQAPRSEEHTSELQSRENLVCRLLLEKKKKTKACNGT